MHIQWFTDFIVFAQEEGGGFFGGGLGSFMPIILIFAIFWFCTIGFLVNGWFWQIGVGLGFRETKSGMLITILWVIRIHSV